MERKGEAFHFDGQCLVDMDVFVNTPATSEPETDKYGHPQYPYGRLTGFDPKFFPGGKRREDQLLLRIKQPAGKGYMVVLYPRLKDNDPPAIFTRLALNAVIVETPLSTDYVFLSPYPFTHTAEKVQFEGMAAAVRFYKSGTIAVSNSEGKAKIVVAGKTVTGEGAFVVTIRNGEATSQTFEEGAHATVQ